MKNKVDLQATLLYSSSEVTREGLGDLGGGGTGWPPTGLRVGPVSEASIAVPTAESNPEEGRARKTVALVTFLATASKALF